MINPPLKLRTVGGVTMHSGSWFHDGIPAGVCVLRQLVPRWDTSWCVCTLLSCSRRRGGWRNNDGGMVIIWCVTRYIMSILGVVLLCWLGFVAKVVDHLTGTMSGLVRWLYDGLGGPKVIWL